jgi:hypothetical protein
MKYADITREVEFGRVAVFRGKVNPNKTTIEEIQKLPVSFADSLNEARALCKQQHDKQRREHVALTQYTIFDGDNWYYRP